MPKTFTKQGTWEHDLRRQIKREHGTGWSLYPQSKRTKRTRRYEDGKKYSVMLEIEWAVGSATAIANEVGVLAARIREQNISLSEAH